ncbi:MAG TPA: SurA N-terminal domain-containing protein [Mycobacteriales bacterium]|nr:SurA N-terminal domain-containing protein [Mycobacteriales bacterium]
MSPRAIVVRTTGAAAIAACTVAVLAGCDSRPSVAAYVGKDRVSTSSLDSTVDHGLDASNVSQVWGQKQDEYRRQVLDEKIYHVILQQAADKEGVSVSDSDVSALSQDILTQDPNGFAGFLGQQGVAPDEGSAFLRDIMLTSEVAIKRGLASVPERYQIGMIEVPNAAAAQAVTRSLQADPGNYEQQAQKYPSASTKPKPIEVSGSDLEQLLGKSAGDLQAGQSLTVQPSQAPGQTFVVHIFDISRPELSSLPSIDRTNTMLAIYQTARPKIVKAVKDEVRINPRFGRWDQAKGTVAQTSNPAVRILKQADTAQ